MERRSFARYTGLIPAAYTPIGADGGVDVACIGDLRSLYAANGMKAVFVCGTTGESASLTTDERKRVAAAWGEAAGDGMSVIVHVGHTSRGDAMDLAAHAASSGAAAIAAFAPHYFKPSSVDDLVAFFEPIAAAAPDLPFYFYDIPGLTGVALATDRFLAAAGPRIPNLAGVKYTNGDLMRLQSCVAVEGGRYDILFGMDEALMAGLSFGLRGAVGSTFNYAAPLYHRIIDAFDRGDLDTARAQQLRSVRLVEVLLEFGVLRAGKAIMGLIGFECGPPRPPLRTLDAAQLASLRDRLDAIGFFDWCCRLPTTRGAAAR